MFLQTIYLIYMYKKDLALNNLQWLICHPTKRNQTESTNRIQIPHRAVCISVCSNALEKGMTPSVLPLVMGKS